jgi:aldehyde dehydrogenase (NAD+)
VQIHDKLYIDGGWVPSTGSDTIDVHDSTNGEVIAQVPAGTADDVDAAATAARAAFESWSQTTPEERAKYCTRIAEGLGARMDEIATVVTREAGMPKWLSLMIQAGLPINSFNTAAQLAESYEYESQLGNSIVVREPVGVVGAITPWNYPLHQVAAKVAYAIAAGCTVVLKPSEVAPLDAFILAEVIHDAGLPAGVFNLVIGTGPVVGEAIARHPQIDMVSFTGSTRAGKRVAELAAQSLKRVALELGGKSANVLLDDLDDEAFEKAVRDGVGKCYLNQGQTCTALTRMLVPADRMADAERIAADEVVANYQPSDPFADGARLGPLASEAQVERVTGYIQKGIDEGAKLVTGGPERPEGFEQGYYVRPTVFSDVRNDMTIAQEEIFGPVLSIIAYEDEDEATRIANDSPYGLSGGV